MPAIVPKGIRCSLAVVALLTAALACDGGTPTPRSGPVTIVSPTLQESNSPTPEEPGITTEEPPGEVTPLPTTGSIRGRVEFTGVNTGPLADTIVEVAGWEEIHWAKTDARGDYEIDEVPPGLQMVIPRTNAGLTSYQSVNVIAGQDAVADFSILPAFPMVATNTLEATILVDGEPVEGAYLWIARSNTVYQSDRDGALSFVYGSAVGSPVVARYQEYWDILEVPFNTDHWDIELTRIGDPPPLPEGMVLVEEQEPVILYALLPTPFKLTLLPGVEVQEDCIAFQGAEASLEMVKGSWKIVVGDIWLLDFGENVGEAKQALKIIQFYGFNQQCFVGRPDASMEYYLNNGRAPSGSLAGEDCIKFDPSAIKVENINDRWKITQGSNWLMDFNRQEAEAQTAYRIIQKYKFDQSCFVGRPDPSLVYFRR